jgi:hypothetical protein
MFGTKTWYIEVIILVVIARYVTAYIIGLTMGFGIQTSLIGIIVFVILAIWRVRKKKVNKKEVVVLFFLTSIIAFGSGLLLPFYLSPFLAIGLIFLIIWRIHVKAVKGSDQAITHK